MSSSKPKLPTPDSRLSLIELVHRLFYSILDPAFDGFTHGIEQALDGLLLLRGELVQHKIGEIIDTRRGRSHPDSEPGIVLPLQGPLDALETVVSPGRARATQSEPSHGKCDVIHQNEEVLTGIELGKGTKRRHCCAAPIHVGLWLEDSNRSALPGTPRLPGPADPAILPQLPA